MIYLVIVLAGLAAGFMNVLAGGGSFLTLPALIAAGLTALGANASSTVALFPAQLVTAAMARNKLAVPAEANGLDIRMLSIISLVGGFFGALLLLITPPGMFLKIVPWLILFATGVFATGGRIGLAAREVRLRRNGVYAIQTAVSIYGGYFGGGIGILMLAALTLFGMRDLRAMTSIKLVLAMLMNVAAVLTFAVTGLVHWRYSLALMAAALVGSLAGMRAANKVAAPYVRGFIIVIGLVLTVGFLLKG